MTGRIFGAGFNEGIDVIRKLNILPFLAAQASLSFTIHTLHAFTEQFMLVSQVLLFCDVLLLYIGLDIWLDHDEAFEVVTASKDAEEVAEVRVLEVFIVSLAAVLVLDAPQLQEHIFVKFRTNIISDFYDKRIYDIPHLLATRCLHRVCFLNGQVMRRRIQSLALAFIVNLVVENDGNQVLYHVLFSFLF